MLNTRYGFGFRAQTSQFSHVIAQDENKNTNKILTTQFEVLTGSHFKWKHFNPPGLN